MSPSIRETSPIRIIVTGEYQDLDSKFPSELGHRGTPLEWIAVPVLRFERLPVSPELVRNLEEHPSDWILFTSQRSVHYWAELLMELGIDFPVQTQVACIGEKTAEAASQDGFTPDFYPTEPGSEKFLEEFEDLLSNSQIKPSVFIPMAEGGRPLISDRLKTLGCSVTVLPLYKTFPRDDIGRFLTQEDIAKSSMILFTSPSSVDAFVRQFSIPEGVAVGSIGRFTSEHLQKKGISSQLLPEGDFERIGEILC